MKTLSWSLLLIVSLCLLGCATAGRPFDSKRAAQIQTGVTTSEQLFEWFGRPQMKTITAEGKTNYMWHHTKTGAVSGLQQQALSVIIGTDGKVEKYSLSGAQ
jgi:ribosomal protein L21E